MRFKQFLENYDENIPRWYEVNVARREIKLRDGTSATLGAFLTYKRGQDDPAMITIKAEGGEWGRGQPLNVFYHDPEEYESLSSDSKISDDECQKEIEKIANALEKANIRDALAIFDIMAEDAVKRLAHGNLFKNLYDGDDDSVNDKLKEALSLNPNDFKTLREKIIVVNNHDEGPMGQYFRLCAHREKSFFMGAKTASEYFTYGIGNNPVHPRTKTFVGEFEPEYYFTVHSKSQLSEKQIDKFFDLIIDTAETLEPNEKLGDALYAAATIFQDHIDQIDMMGDLYDGDNDENEKIQNRVRKHLK